MFSKLSAMYYRALHIGFALADDAQLQQTIIDQDTITNLHILRQSLIGRRNELCITDNITSSNCHVCSINEHDGFPVLQRTGAYLRPL